MLTMNTATLTTKRAIIWRRVRGLIELRELSIQAAAAALGITPQHFAAVMSGRRNATPALHTGLRRLLGPAGYRFAVGRSDGMRDPGPLPASPPADAARAA